MFNLTIDLGSNTLLLDKVNDIDNDIINVYRILPDSVELKHFGYKYEITYNGSDNGLIGQLTELYDEEQPNLIGQIRIFSSEVALQDCSLMLNVVAFNLRKSFENTFELKFPKPESPFPSWSWNKEIKSWEAPIQKPELAWDEQKQEWYLP